MLLFRVFAFLAYISYLNSFAFAQLQFIYYNGSITGKFQPGESSPKSCISYYLGTIANAGILVGVNPPWDTNPFYIEFTHSGNVANSTLSQCIAPPCTFDAVWDLSFASAGSACVKDATDDNCQYEMLEF